jgi:hypothetical protein
VSITDDELRNAARRLADALDGMNRSLAAMVHAATPSSLGRDLAELAKVGEDDTGEDVESCEVCEVLMNTLPDLAGIRYALQGGAFIAAAEWEHPANRQRLADGFRPVLRLVRCCSSSCAGMAYDAVVWQRGAR